MTLDVLMQHHPTLFATLAPLSILVARGFLDDAPDVRLRYQTREILLSHLAACGLFHTCYTHQKRAIESLSSLSRRFLTFLVGFIGFFSEQ